MSTKSETRIALGRNFGAKNLIPGIGTRRNSEKLNRRQTLALPLLAAGLDHSEIARRLRTYPSTVKNWSRLPLVVVELERLAADSWARTRTAILDAGPAAVQVLREAMADTDKASAIRGQRITAASEVLRLQIKATEGAPIKPPATPEQTDLDALLTYAARQGVLHQLRARGCPEEEVNAQADRLLETPGARDQVLDAMAKAVPVPMGSKALISGE